MNNRIAIIIRDYIDGLPWVDKIAGLTQVARISQTDSKIEKRFPISCDLAFEDACREGCYDNLTPDSSKKSIVYFEEGSLTFQRRIKNRLYYDSTLRLVGWLNYNLLGGGCGSAAKYIIDIIASLPQMPVDFADFRGVTIEVMSQAQRDSSIFGKYTYNEKQTQYLMLPYDYFALDIRTRFYIIPECVNLPEEGCEECS